ncbi:hypothetical protein [Actinoplanes sp. NPDC049599]|uniref:hypothetical protein n=1 Tax=Actinoplanes sp. NPDC049599 TaxID=3363903 RepID=UPI0037B0D51D
MATTLMPLDPAVSPQRVTRLLTISASLLPDEIIAARRARRTRAWVIVVVILVACLLGGFFYLVRQDTRAADDELTAATAEVADLQRAQRVYGEVVDVQNDTATLSRQLKTAMASDLDWASLLEQLRSIGETAGVTVVGINGALQDATMTTAGTALPSTSASVAIGSAVVTGTGPDKGAVAAYVDALAKQSVLANPYLTNVTSTEGSATSTEESVTWTLRVDITQAALCGRFGDKCETGGK